MSKEIVSVYEGEKLVVTYDRRRCIHAAECGRGNNKVFDVSKDPWIDPDLDDMENIIKVIQRCPSGALIYKRKDGGSEESEPEGNSVAVNPDGPLYARGRIEILRSDGTEIGKEYRVALCRCGRSKDKPFCDHSHLQAKFSDAGPVNADPDPGVELGEGALKITALKDGPLQLQGPMTIYAGSGRMAMRTDEVFLCRCGASNNKPFCDGTHSKVGFRGD